MISRENNLFLKILSPVYHGVTSLRNFLYDKGYFSTESVDLPVICVGNLTTGGNGKTPFCNYLSRRFAAEGRKAIVLSRGYKGSLRGPHQVSPANLPAEVGDEALEYLANEVDVVISKDRASGAKFIQNEKLAEIIILDDGLQHRRLERDLNLLLVDISSEKAVLSWNKGELLPSGDFRESKTGGLRRADAIIYVDRFSSTKPKIEAKRTFLPEFNFKITPSIIRDLKSDQTYPLTELSGREVAVLTAIAKPTGFCETLEGLGCKLSEKKFYSDHYLFNEDKIRSYEKESSLPIVVTEKDAVKISPYIKQDNKWFSLVVEGSFTSELEECGFLKFLRSG